MYTPTTTPYSTVPTIKEVDNLYFTIIILCFTLGTSGNIISLIYFLTKTKDIPTTLYTIISTVDVIVSVLVLPLGLPYVLGNRYGWLLETSQVVCTTWGVMWYTCTVLSVFLVAVMSISRTVHLVWPFKTLSKRVVLGVVLGYVKLLVVQSTIPLWVGEGYKYDYSMTGLCTWTNTILGNGTVEYHIYTQLIFFQTYFPLIPILISCFLTIHSLKSSDNNALNRANRSVTVTIILFTILYVLCNLPKAVMYLFTIIIQNYNLDLVQWDRRYWYFFKFYSTLLIPINSALNPVLYLCRMRKMRRWTKEKLERWGVRVGVWRGNGGFRVIGDRSVVTADGVSEKTTMKTV